jgi:hypothetical protein
VAALREAVGADSPAVAELERLFEIARAYGVEVRARPVALRRV